MLLLKRHLIDLVRRGLKRQTIRIWRRPMVRAGQLAFTPGLGRVRIVSVTVLGSLGALTERDARADGFASRRALLAELRRIYGRGIPKERSIFRVRFAWPAEGADARRRGGGDAFLRGGGGVLVGAKRVSSKRVFSGRASPGRSGGRGRGVPLGARGEGDGGALFRRRVLRDFLVALGVHQRALCCQTWASPVSSGVASVWSVEK